jgi:hypothetical protein
MPQRLFQGSCLNVINPIASSPGTSARNPAPSLDGNSTVTGFTAIIPKALSIDRKK